MTTVDKLNISRRLALAIGWKPEQITPVYIMLRGERQQLICWNAGGRPFWYHDHKITWAIAERYNAFPVRWKGRWRAKALDLTGSPLVHEDTPELAVAMAVIHAHKV